MGDVFGVFGHERSDQDDGLRRPGCSGYMEGHYVIGPCGVGSRPSRSIG